VNGVTEFLVGVIYIAIIYALVRPTSPAAGVVQTISDAMVGVVGSATGYNQLGGIG
jgi:xanthosine utilization system XapX-like protein